MWFDRKPKSIDMASLISVNVRASIEVGGRSYPSRVEDIKGMEVYLAAPFAGYMPIRFRSGQKIRLAVLIDDNYSAFTCTVRMMKLVRPVPMVVVHHFVREELETERDATRVNDVVPVRYRKFVADDDPAEWRHGITSDISTNGVRVHDRSVLALGVGDKVQVEMELSKKLIIPAVAEIVRVTQPNAADGKCGIGLSYTQISGSDRDKLTRYIKQRRKELVESHIRFVKCGKQLITSFKKAEGGKRWLAASPYDMTAIGLRLITLESGGLKDGDIAEIALKLPRIVPFEVKSEVLWVRSSDLKDEGGYEIGVRFLNLSDRHATLINSFVGRMKENSLRAA